MPSTLQTLSFPGETKELEIMPETYHNIYSLHKYWAKKPFNVVNALIQKYSKKNEIVLDPFCGSGISLIESLNSNRKAIGIDINPAAIFITKEILVKNEIRSIEKEFQKIQQDCEEKINNLYLVHRNGHSFVGSHFIWAKGKLIEIRHYDKKKRWINVRPKRTDTTKAMSFSYSKIRHFYPKDRLFHNSKINADSNTRICDLFTPRNTYALSFLLNRINKIKNRNIRDLFRFCFSSSLGQTSKMVFVLNHRKSENGKKKRKIRRQIGSWVIGYWTPKEHFELNVWDCFIRRYYKILNAKIEQQNQSKEPKFVSNFKDLRTGNLFLIKNSALKALKKIPSNSIDYVLADPPHGNRIPYLELSMMWNSWLRNKVNYNDEIVISSAKGRKKDADNYNLLLGKTLKEIVRVLKPKRYFTLMFNAQDHKTWLDLFNNFKKSGLKIDELSSIGYSHKSVVQKNRDHGLKHDFLLTFKKVKK